MLTRYIKCSTLIEGAEAQSDEEALAAAAAAAEREEDEEAAAAAPAEDAPATAPSPATVTASRSDAVRRAPAATRSRQATAPARTLTAALNSAKDLFRSSGSYSTAISELNRPVINAALADVTRTEQLGRFPRTALSELWTPVLDRSPVLQYVCTRFPLDAYRISDWVWGTRPAVDSYIGNKTQLPTNEPTIVPVELNALSLAGAHDVDRALIDFNTGFRESYFTAMMQSLATVLASKVISAISTGGTGGATYGSFGEGLTGACKNLIAAGARADYILVSPDVWSMWGNTPAVDMPIAAAGSVVDVTRGGYDTLAPGQIPLIAVPGLTAGTMTVGDKRATNVWTTEGIQAEAINLPMGGIDLGVVSYYQTYISSESAIQSVGISAS